MALPLTISWHWQTVPDLTIHDAAFWMVIQSDPLSHKLLCDLNNDQLDHYYDHPGGFEAVCKICDVLICEARAGNIKTTLAHPFLSAAITQDDLISKSDWIDWCRQNGYVALSNLFSQYNVAITPLAGIQQPVAPVAITTASTPVYIPITPIKSKYAPSNAVGKLAVKAAIQIEEETTKLASSKSVMKRLQQWADDGSEPSTLIKSDKPKHAVIWTTNKQKHNGYTLSACEKTLERWNKGRQ